MIRVDITCDLMDEDETGHVWAFLRDARDQALVQPGAIVVAGDEDAPAVAEVVDIVDKRRPGGPPSYPAGAARGLSGSYPASGHTGLTALPDWEDDLPNSSQYGNSSHPCVG